MSETLFPIIVPRTYFAQGNWPGFHRTLRHPELAVTWVELGDAQMMSYVNKERQRDIESRGEDIHELAMANLRRQSSELFTHHKAEGDRTLLCVMMHADGLGTSRLLLLPELRQAYSDGFWIGIPERSFGVIVPNSVSAAERNDALELVNRCHREGITPMLRGLHEADGFEVVAP
jgi:hypothetical protein